MLLAGLLLLLPGYADDGVDLGLSQGREPLTLDAAGHARLAPNACGRCHEDEQKDWQGSRHRVAWTNSIFQAGFIAEPEPFCINCHAPVAPQAAQVMQNLPWYRALNPRSPAHEPLPSPEPEPLAAHGIACVTCHWRDGAVLSTEVSGGAPHSTRAVPELADGTLCKQCHEFPVVDAHNGSMTFSDEPMQSTWTEWNAWRSDGHEETCVQCHMPGGRHVFRGAHDVAFLRGSVDVRVKDDKLVLRAVNVGHQLPTGDLFRHLTVEARVRGEDWRVVHTIGRTFAVQVDAETGQTHKRMSLDTSLRPGEPRTVNLPTGARWRVRYHYGSQADERRGLVGLDTLIVVLHEG